MIDISVGKINNYTQIIYTGNVKVIFYIILLHVVGTSTALCLSFDTKRRRLLHLLKGTVGGSCQRRQKFLKVAGNTFEAQLLLV
jgi:hypothetical protein